MTDSNVRRQQQPQQPRRSLSARSQQVLRRLDRAVAQAAQRRYVERLEQWAAAQDADAAYPSRDEVVAEVRAEHEVLVRALGAWAGCEDDPIGVLGKERERRRARALEEELRRRFGDEEL